VKVSLIVEWRTDGARRLTALRTAFDSAGNLVGVSWCLLPSDTWSRNAPPCGRVAALTAQRIGLFLGHRHGDTPAVALARDGGHGEGKQRPVAENGEVRADNG
jgi:hypothetical protein